MDCVLTVYHMWKETNSRIFQQKGVKSAAVVRSIQEEVRACVCSWKNLQMSAENQRYCLAWGIPLFVFQQNQSLEDLQMFWLCFVFCFG